MILTILIASLTYSASHAVTIPDGNLAAAVREALGLGATDPIPQTALEKLGNQISDISPLAKLTHLTALGLGRNQIQDLSPIAESTQLSVLHVDRNRIKDISQIEQFTSLTSL